MPNVTVHERIGYYISKKININTYNYYLGLLAPDAPNLNGFAEKIERWTAHLRKKDYNEWKDNLNAFYSKEKNNYPKDFILGYYIHIMTDIIYDELLYLKVKEKILNDNYKNEDAHDIMREDMDKYSFNEIEEIKEKLKEKTDYYDILNINKELLSKWKDKEISFFPRINNSKYITEDIINTLSEEVYKMILEENII